MSNDIKAKLERLEKRCNDAMARNGRSAPLRDRARFEAASYAAFPALVKMAREVYARLEYGPVDRSGQKEYGRGVFAGQKIVLEEMSRILTDALEGVEP